MSEVLPKDYPAITPQHTAVRDAIWAAMKRWRRFLISIDGVDGAGKSTIGRYLSWQLGMPVIETDLFLVRNTGRIEHHLDELRSLMEVRLTNDKPVIVEGVVVLQTLKQLNLPPDYSVWIEQAEWDGSHALGDTIQRYVADYAPKENAHFTLQWRDEGDGLATNRGGDA